MSAWDDVAHYQSDVLSLARGAMIVSAHRVPRLQRWLTLELHGYAELPDGFALHAVLGVEPADPLVLQVASYRMQRSLETELPGNYVRESHQHFFTESLPRLVVMADLVRRHPGPAPISLKFRPQPGGIPPQLDFPSNLFDRMLDGFRLTVHAQLRAVP